jgi:hydrogenase small subunit
MPCLGCTEPEFPFHDLAPGTVFKTLTSQGIPTELPEISRASYLKLATAAKMAMPVWAEEDMFIV